MSKQLSEQASELWNTVSAPQTAETYKNTVSLTWQIIKRLGLTIWLALCLILVAGDWLVDTALSSGKSARLWLENLQNSDSEKLTAMTSEQILNVGKQSLASAVANARQQLGLPEKPVTPLLAPSSTSEVQAIAETTAQTIATSADPVKKS